VLWRLLYESAARASEVLALDVIDLDQPNRRARVGSKGGNTDWIHWQTATARLLPRLLRGPVFLASKRPAPARQPARAGLDPDTGRARLSYSRARELFSGWTGFTLHQLRHSALTHLAEDGMSTLMLQSVSRHASLRTLQRYARPSAEAVGRELDRRDPARRGRRDR
jgi:integrase/recombinase XerC/integrase/recombinase XerD